MAKRRGTARTAALRPAAVALLAVALLAGCSSDPAPDRPAAAVSVTPASASASAPAVVGFAGLTLSGAAELSAKPRLSTARSAAVPAALRVKDVVTGSGTAATPDSTVTVQYVGVRLADGKQVVSTWEHGGATSFALRSALPGLARGIGGEAATEPMRAGGRRILIVPAALAYGRAGTPDRSIGPNAALAFVVDLIAVS